MHKYLAVDSGGTKVAAILYDDSFRPLKTARAGSMRQNTTSQNLIDSNVESLFSQLGITPDTEIAKVSGIYDGYLLNRLSEYCTVGSSESYGELGLGLYAAGIFGDGILSLSGTGSTTFAKFKGKTYILGGYGAAVSDEGSGYWMSRIALDCAIKSYEGRGEKTLLEDLITEHFGRSDLRDAIFSIYSAPDKSPAACVASCAPVVEKAAYAGDRIALKIIEDTGRSLGEQLLALMRINNIPNTLPVTISGSVWRGHPLMFANFKNTVTEKDSGINIIVPEFEPIVGSVIGHYYAENGKFEESDREFFRTNYSEYLFNIKK